MHAWSYTNSSDSYLNSIVPIIYWLQLQQLLILFSVELEAEIRLTVDELMREELKNLKLVCFVPLEDCVSPSAFH